jgi:hypothetical protein
MMQMPKRTELFQACIQLYDNILLPASVGPRTPAKMRPSRGLYCYVHPDGVPFVQKYFSAKSDQCLAPVCFSIKRPG